MNHTKQIIEAAIQQTQIELKSLETDILISLEEIEEKKKQIPEHIIKLDELKRSLEFLSWNNELD